jgi:hypothetical protein
MDAIQYNCPMNRNKKIGLLHDNVPVHTSQIAKFVFVPYTNTNLKNHPANSPDSAFASQCLLSASKF